MWYFNILFYFILLVFCVFSDEEEESGEEEGSESEEGEDDPSKLWCICREPHNNRFMICCDKCEDWFHGSCVGVNRAMGRELEVKGLEWYV